MMAPATVAKTRKKKVENPNIDVSQVSNHTNAAKHTRGGSALPEGLQMNVCILDTE